MKILITGIAGFIGSNAAEYFLNKGHEVFGIDNFNDYYDVKLKRDNAESVKDLGGHVLEADLNSKEAFDHIINTNPDVIIHLAAQPGISSTVSFNEYRQNNIDATYNVLEAANKLENLHLFINIATSSVYGYDATISETEIPKPASYYGSTKLAAEQLALMYHTTYGLPVTSFRLYSVIGPKERPDKLWTKIIDVTLNKKAPVEIYEGSREHLRSFTNVFDICEAFDKAIQYKDNAIGEVFNIGSNQTITVGEGLDILEKVIGESLNIKDVNAKRIGDQTKTSAVITKAEKSLNWKPETDFKTSMQQAVDWFKNSIYI